MIKSPIKSKIRAILAIGGLMYIIITTGILLFIPVPDANVQIVGNILSFVAGIVVAAPYQFFFGDSEGKQEVNQ